MMSSASPQALAAAAAARLRRWLLDTVQLAEGEQRGGVAGSIDAEGRARYVYGEITGYYLTWLSSPHLAELPERQARAAAAADWAERNYLADTLPPTRIYLDGSGDDWRNRLQFCFDLAMLAGGLAKAHRAQLIGAHTELLRRLGTTLAGYAAADGLRPFEGDAEGIQRRWSTRSGPFLVKAAHRIARCADVVALPPALAAAIELHLRRWPPRPAAALAEPAHPSLYHLEGWMGLGRGAEVECAATWANIAATADAEGSLPESVDNPTVRRSDIVAQALRVGVELATLGLVGADGAALLDRMAMQLVRRVAEDGSIAFVEDASPRLCSVWCAMFAEQALVAWSDWRGGIAPRITADDWV
jgi:hypothetical protein